MKVAYAGFDLLSPCLEALEEAGCQIMKLFTFPTNNVYEFNRAVTDFAQKRNIPWTDQRVTSGDLLALLDQGCEALFSAGYIYKIPVDTPLRCANVHPALLPLGRGPWPMPCTILKGLRESGVTIHKVAAGFDTGDILLQRPFPVTEADTLETMTETIRRLAPQVLAQAVRDFDRLWDKAVPQGAGEYWPEPAGEELVIRTEDAAARADRVVRAFAGYGCTLRLPDGDITVLRGEARREDHGQRPGTVRLADGAREYALSDGWLRVLA